MARLDLSMINKSNEQNIAQNLVIIYNDCFGSGDVVVYPSEDGIIEKLLPLFSDDEELSESDIKPTQDQPLAVVWIKEY